MSIKSHYIHWGASLVAQMVKNPPAKGENLGSIPGLGRSPGGGHGNTFQYPCLKNPNGQRSLVGYSPWGCKELDTKLLTHDGVIKHYFSFSLWPGK